MGMQIDALAAQPAANVTQCSAESCAEPAVATFETRSLCMEHFICGSMRELESRSEPLRTQPFDAAANESFRKFLALCTAQAKGLLESEQNSQSPAKERLLDVLLLVSQLSQRLRRGPRTPTSVSVWLRREDPGQTWEEESWTSSISQHGAGLICRHRVEPGRTVFLCRKDKGGRARARVVYSHFDSGGDRQIGVEILDRDDFWDAKELARGTNAPADSTNPPPAEQKSAPVTVQADLEVQIEGQTALYKDLPFQLVTQGKQTRLSGTIPLALSDLKIDPASLSATENGLPVRIHMTWREEKKVPTNATSQDLKTIPPSPSPQSA
jgi:hypothetical protein